MRITRDQLLSGLLCASLTGFVLLLHDARWIGEWSWSLDTVADSTTLTAPVIAAHAGWMIHVNRGLAPVISTSARGYRHLLVVAWRAFLPGAAVLALGVAAATIVNIVDGPTGGPVRLEPLGVAVGLLGLFALAGSLVAAAAPTLVTVCLTPFVVFLVSGLGFAGIGPKTLRVGGSTGSLAGVRFDEHYIAAQLAFIVLAALALGIVGVAVLGRIGWSAISLAGLGLCLTGLVVTSVYLMGPVDRYAPSAEGPTSCDTHGSTRLCVYPSHVRSMRGMGEPLARFQRTLRGQELTSPTLYAEMGPRVVTSPDRGWLIAPNGGPVRVDSETDAIGRAAVSAALPRACPYWFGATAPGQDKFATVGLLANLLLRTDGYPWTPATEAERVWASSPQADQWAWGKRAFTALRTCQARPLPLPPGVGAELGA